MRVKTFHSLLGPDVVIMRKHHCLWHSCCSRCIDQCATISWLDFIHSFMDSSRVNFQAHRNKLSIGDNFIAVFLFFKSRIIVEYDQLNFSLLKQIIILSSICPILSQDSLGLRMPGNILTRLDIVGAVYSNRNAPCEETPIEGKAPLWSIEANYID